MYSARTLRRLIRETLLLESESQATPLYHATCFPPESFKNGIVPSKAKGFGQGEGFYLFANKERAIRHGRDISSTDSALSKEVACEPGPDGKIKAYIITITEPITPENFDVDYEIYSDAYISFILNNNEQLEPIFDKIGIIKVNQQNKVVIFNVDFPEQGNKRRLTIGLRGEEGSNVRAAEIMSKSAQALSQIDPTLFHKFESEFLPTAHTLKWNGKKTIFPSHIEDLEGNSDPV
jgi:hypothetical protein